MSAMDELRGIIEIIAQKKLGLDDEGYILAWERRWRSNIVLQQLLGNKDDELATLLGWINLSQRIYENTKSLGVKEPEKRALEDREEHEMRHVLSILRHYPLEESNDDE